MTGAVRAGSEERVLLVSAGPVLSGAGCGVGRLARPACPLRRRTRPALGVLRAPLRLCFAGRSALEVWAQDGCVRSAFPGRRCEALQAQRAELRAVQSTLEKFQKFPSGETLHRTSFFL